MAFGDTLGYITCAAGPPPPLPRMESMAFSSFCAAAAASSSGETSSAVSPYASADSPSLPLSALEASPSLSSVAEALIVISIVFDFQSVV